jgi:predicted transcriptional regulator of viral defense system
MRNKPAKGDLVIARIAASQHGVVSAAQLRAARIDRTATFRRVESGRLHRIRRGVYAVGHTSLSFEGRCMAAVLTLGEAAVVSHDSAAALWGLLPDGGGRIHVTLPSDGGRETRSDLAIHRSLSLVAGLSTRLRGVPVTKPARTLRDVRRTLPDAVFRVLYVERSTCD